MAKYTPDQVTRLQQVHNQAIFGVKQQIQHWEKVTNDYNSLAARLQTLPEKVTHEVMVPFGPLAFMPGHLIHTNELLVHMGDTWFADVSCKQGLKIIDHRLEIAQKNNEDLNKTLKNLEQKLEFSQELNNTGGEGSFEIQETLPEGYVHPGKRKRISRVKPPSGDTDPENKSPTAAAPSCFNDEELMRRLDELEKQEEEEDELLLNSDGSSTPETNHTEDSLPSKTANTFSKKKKVSWKNKLEISKWKEADSDDSDEDSTIRIKIKHTNTPVKSETSYGRIINSPADIGRKKETKKEEVLNDSKRSGLDKLPRISVAEDKTAEESGQCNIEPTRTRDNQISVAVSDTVLERSMGSSGSRVQSVSHKPVSKFKASRKR